jgi:hypothetical protein
MLLFATTGTGLAVLVTDRSAEPATSTLAEALLLPGFGSLAEVTVSVCVIVDPGIALVFTFTMNVKFAVVTPRVEMVQVSVPTEQVQPAGPVSDTAVVLAGRVSASEIVLALAGPVFTTVCV